MRRRTLSWWLSVVLLTVLAPCVANAAGLGRLAVLSSLGQPLNAEIELLSVQKGETITARLASQEVYQQAGVQFNNALTGTRVTVEKRPNGQLYLKATTPRPINEPFIELVIEMNSEHGRVVRQYTALLDPPGYGRAAGEVPPPRTTTAESAPPPPVTASPAPAPKVAEAPLAPPARTPAPSRQKPTASAGEKQYGPVKPGETLSGIARTVRPEGVTLEQTLVSLYQRNPEAFINRNMNLIKSGKILRVPEAQEMSAVARSDATQEVRMQVADFNAYRNRVADRAVSAPESGSVRSGRIEPRVAERGAGEAPRDRVRVSRGEPAGKDPAVSTNVADRVRALEEEVIAREKALAEANERITQLERIIKDTQRAIELKSSTMAAAQQAAEKAAPPAQSDRAPATAAAKGTEQPPRAEAPPPAAAPEAQKETDSAKEAAPAQALPAPKAQAQAPAAPEPASQPDFISALMEEPLYLAAAGAVVVLGGIGLFLVRKRRAAERGWPDEDEDSIGKIAPTLGGDTAPDDEVAPAASAERVVPRAPAERPKAAPPEAMAGIVAALTSARTESAGDDNDLDFHGTDERADARTRTPEPVRATEVGAVKAQSTAASAVDASQGRTAQPTPTRSGESAPAVKAAESAVPEFLLNPRSGTSAGATEVAASKPQSTASSAAESKQQTGATAQKMDFDLVPRADPQGASAETRPNLDFKLDLDDLDLNAPAQRAGDAARDEHWHDVQQKFDLAKAYEDMGDKQGARDILQEVIREGDTQQQVQARRRLESLT
jgi:pilus assembly protein FimV